MRDLRELLQHEVQDLYSAETQWLEALPKMSNAVKDNRLKQTFSQHLNETRKQKERLEEVANAMKIKPKGVKCEGIEGLIREGEKIMKENQAGTPVNDAAIIAAAQKVEHYQMAGYGTARTYAQLVGENHVADLLGKCLDEVKNTDRQLTNVALETVNPEALVKNT
jgi:ferritin-like metal-binding protein YciE